ncbi:MAG: DUF2786 domain-containing protein [Deltaproteobacteria bacterium]|jgi:predicted SprT family Zn-dependent metalloprotease|nr:DUF2786 domain-containing protein [Deltaproteobacteria bacterium]
MNNNTHEKLTRYSRVEYHRKWLHQLRAEFEQICSWYNISLATPAFRISESKAVLGAWNPDSRTISISAALISEYSWDTVINVLKHEMAHQYVHEPLNRKMEQAHGPGFSAACERLGVLHPFNTASGDSPKILTGSNMHSQDEEYNKRINKVRKILSLAGSSNENEAAAAMSKANSLIRKYNLERLARVESAQYRYEIKNTGKKRLHVIERRIASLLMDFFYVDVVYSELFDAGKAEYYKTIELLGSLENVTFAGYVYEFLKERVEYLWKNFRRTSRSPGRLRKTYILGLLQGFREKLEREEKKQSMPAGISQGEDRFQTISALVVAKDSGLNDFVAKRFPRLRKVRYTAPGIYCPDTYSAGKAEGKKITIYKTVEREEGNLGALLSN